MAEQNNNRNLIIIISLAAALISASLIFAGIQFGNRMSPEDLKTQIFTGIDDYIAEQQAKAEEEAKKVKTWQVEGDFADDDPYLGKEDAPVTIVEFSDYECYYCGRFHFETFPQIKANYIDTGKVKFVYRDHPIEDLHANAYSLSYLAECVNEQVDNETYFKMHNKILETIASTGYNYETLSAYAKELGVDTAKLKKCFDDKKYKDEIDADIADAEKAGLRPTPAFIINNTAFSGAYPYEKFSELIEAELAEK